MLIPLIYILFSIEEEHFILYKKGNIIKRPICLWSIFKSRFEIQHFIFVNLHYILFYLATSKFPFQGAMYNQRFIYWLCRGAVQRSEVGTLFLRVKPLGEKWVLYTCKYILPFW